MLAGEGAVAIWNDIAEAGRAEFYAWHLHEHMPERVGIPGFVRGRRYRAADATTQPEFFTLYETLSFQVIQGSDYLSRLNAPTEWTRAATAHFQSTTRSLTRVVASHGVGSGGAMLTMRFDIADDAQHAAVPLLSSALEAAARLPRISGAHLWRRVGPVHRRKPGSQGPVDAGAVGGVAGGLRRQRLGRGSSAIAGLYRIARRRRGPLRA
jgi:hypothetical protein